MSAYLVEKRHIIFLVAAAHARKFQDRHSSFSFYDGRCTHYLKPSDYKAAADIANMLWLENAKSLAARYPNDKDSGVELITVRDICGTHFDEISAAQVFKSISCYEYQSCEHDGWKDSAAYAFCRSLEGDVIRSLPGYEDAAWGAPEKAVAVKNDSFAHACKFFLEQQAKNPHAD